MYSDLRNKKILVTGGSRGIGAAICRQLSDAGSQVTSLSRSVPESEHCEWIEMDASDSISVQAALERLTWSVEEIDGIVFNSGAFSGQQIADITVEAWRNQLAVNAQSAQVVLTQLWEKLNDASLVFVTSLAAVPGVEKFATSMAYTASKYAQRGVCEIAAVEGKEKGIRANCVAPGSVDTEMLSKAYPDLKADFAPDEVARAVLYFLSDASAPVTAETLALAP